MDFDRFEGVRGRPNKGLDVRKTYFGAFPEFDTNTITRGTDVIPIYEEGKPSPRRLVTILEDKKIKDRHAAVKAELGLTGTGRNLRPIAKIVEEKHVDDAAGDAKYYQEQLGRLEVSWEEL